MPSPKPSVKTRRQAFNEALQATVAAGGEEAEALALALQDYLEAYPQTFRRSSPLLRGIFVAIQDGFERSQPPSDPDMAEMSEEEERFMADQDPPPRSVPVPPRVERARARGH